MLQTVVCFETDDEKWSCEENVFHCVKCSKLVFANVRKLISFFEKTSGSLTLLSNPFEARPSSENSGHEKIAAYVFYFTLLILIYDYL